MIVQEVLDLVSKKVQEGHTYTIYVSKHSKKPYLTLDFVKDGRESGVGIKIESDEEAQTILERITKHLINEKTN